MTRKGMAVQGLLAASALGVAYFLSQGRDSAGLTDPIILELRTADLQSLKYFDGKRHYTVEPDPELGAGELRVHVTGAERKFAPNMPPDKVPDREIRGGRLAKDLWAAFTPLRAMRTLGKLPQERLVQLGLADTQRRLVVKARGLERSFRLATPPAGAVEPYLLSEDDDKVYMVQRVIMNSFSERALGPDRPHAFELFEFDRMVLTPVGHPPIAFRGVRGEGIEMALHPEASLSANRAAIEQWHANLFTLSIDDVLGRDETPDFGPPKTELRLEYWLGRDRQGWMDLAVGTFRGEQRLYFRTEQSYGWMIGGPGSHTLLLEAQKLFVPRAPT